MQTKLKKQDDVHDRFSKFNTDSQPEFNERGRKWGHEEASGHFYRRTRRKSARRRFLLRTIMTLNKKQQRNTATQK